MPKPRPKNEQTEIRRAAVITSGGAIINIAELKNTHRNAAREYRAQLSRHGLVRKSDFPNE